MEILGYIASLFIGISLGLIGGGGSILTVPALVYLFSVSPSVAISNSLFIVGITSLVGAYKNYIQGQVSVKVAGLFGLTSVVTVFIIRKFVVPLLPEVFFRVGNFVVSQAVFLMVLFAVLMLAASYSMINTRTIQSSTNEKQNLPRLIFFGIMVGLVTGFLGAGGGFLLIPALVFFMKLPMKKAIGTSLLIISLNSLAGFLSSQGLNKIEWPLILTVTTIAIIGILLGSALNKKVNGAILKKGFGWFVLIMGAFIIIKELFLK